MILPCTGMPSKKWSTMLPKHPGKVKCKHQEWFDESDQSVQDLLLAGAATHWAHLWYPGSASKGYAFLSA